MKDRSTSRALPTVVDLFAGVGGFSLGFINAKSPEGEPLFDVRLLVDNDGEAAYTFKKNFPSVSYLVKDITTVTAEEIRRHARVNSPDIIIGGPPCQGFSAAGKRLFDDERNALLKEYVRLVSSLQPRVALMENVPTLFGSVHGAYGEELKETLSKNGYDAKAEVIRASDFGVPQVRKRAFVLAVRKDINVSHPGFPVPDGFRINPVTVEDALSDLPSLKAGEGTDAVFYLSRPTTAYQHRMRNGAFILFNHLARRHSPSFLEKISVIPEGGGNKDLDPDIQFSDNYFSQAYARLDRRAPAYTITTCFLNPGSGRFIHYRDLRSITSREAARLQSFDDNFIFHGPLVAMERHIGNAVPPILSQTLAQHISPLFFPSIKARKNGKIHG